MISFILSVLIVLFFFIYWFRRTRLFECPACLENPMCWSEKKMEEIRGRLSADHCNGANSQTTWTHTHKKNQSCYRNWTSNCFVFRFLVLLAQALYWGLWERGYVYVHVQVLKAEMWRWEEEGFIITPAPALQSYLLCVHDQQVDRKHTFPMRQSNQGNWTELCSLLYFAPTRNAVFQTAVMIWKIIIQSLTGGFG